MLIYKKSFKKCLSLFHKTFSNFQATYQKELYLLFEKSINFSQSEHRDMFDSSPSPVCFHLLFKDPLPTPQQTQGFLQVLRTWGGGESSAKFNLEEGGLSQYMKKACERVGGRLKFLLKNTCGRVHFIVKLPAIILQACKFNKNELLHSYF